MNRRSFLFSLSSFSALGLTLPQVFSLEPSQEQGSRIDHVADERSETNPQSAFKRKLSVGIVGIVGHAVYQLDGVAQTLNFPCKQIAIETNLERLRWCHAKHTLLITDQGSRPGTVRDVQLMARDRKAEISQLLSNLDVVFLLTGMDGVAGRGVTSVVAEVLGELGIFTIAILPHPQDPDAVTSLRSMADIVFEIPRDVLLDQARELKDTNAFDFYFRQLVPDAIGQICRVITHSLADVGPRCITAESMRWLLRGNDVAIVGYGNGDGSDGCLAALQVASTSPLLGLDRIQLSQALMVSIESKSGALREKDIDLVTHETSKIARRGARLHFGAFQN